MECKYRSRLADLPLDLKCEIAELPYQKGMRPSTKKNKIIELLHAYQIDFTELGTGTNRFIVKFEGYALKMALDNEGVADNKQEWVMSAPLERGRAVSLEIAKGGNLLMAEYAGAFQSYSEMYAYRNQILDILSFWNSKGFLLGDVGLSRVNYANWGLLPTGVPVCIDYAYIFPANMNLFECECGSKNIAAIDDYTGYKCDKCGKEYQDRELRMRISNQTRLDLFKSVDGVEMRLPEEVHTVDEKYIRNKVTQNPDVISDEEVALRLAQLDMTHAGGNWYRT